jgi:chemotaxis-related protein WspB
MLFLVFQIGNDRYALDAGGVVEVVPFLSLKRIPQAPKGVAGLFNYRGRPVPAVDLCDLTLGQPARVCLSTRIIIVKHPDASGENRLLGLIAEHATEMLRKDAREFADAGVGGGAPYLGPVIMDGKGVIRWLHAQRLLEPDMRDLLFPQTPELTHENV